MNRTIQILNLPDSADKMAMLARAVLTGELDAGLGAGLLAELLERLRWNEDALEFQSLAHLFEEDLPGFPRTDITADIVSQCRRLAGD